MRFCTFRLRSEGVGKARLGVVTEDGVGEVDQPSTMQGLLEGGSSAVRHVKVRRKPFSGAEVILNAPLPRPKKIVAAIVNTQGMLGGEDVPLSRPRIDMKAPSTVIGPNQRILALKSGVRPEVELAAIVGRKATKATVKEAKEAIFGYTVLNDITAPKDARDDAYQAYRRDRTTNDIRKVTLRGPLFRSKNHDTFCPTGPWIVTADELGETRGLRMTAAFRGSLVQDGNTSEYIFPPEELVSYISQFLTLEPGDVVSCGSVGWTKESLGKLDPSEFILPLKNGVLELNIDGIGKLRNPVVYQVSR